MAFAVVLLMACAEDDAGWQGVVSGTPGYRQVVNPSDPLGGSESNLLHLEWSTSGASNADDLWAEPRQISVGQGTVFVTDPQLSRVHRVSLSGKLLPGVGRSGRGPGEFEEPWLALASEEALWVLDPAGGKVERVSDTGESLGAIQTEGVVFEARPWSDSLLIQRWTDAAPVWWVVGPSGFDRTLELPGLDPLEADEDSPCSRVSTGEGVIYLLRCRALEWYRIDPDGRPELVVSAPVTAPVVTDEQLDGLLNAAREVMGELGFPADQVEVELDRIRDQPGVQRAFRELAVDHKSGIVTVWEQTPDEFGSGPARIHLFSESGVYLATQEVSESWVDVAVDQGMLFALVVDEATDLRSLKAYRLEIPSSVRERLAAVEGQMDLSNQP
jgi:hypothetical protein